MRKVLAIASFLASRLLRPEARWIYILVAAVGLAPILLAWAIGTAFTSPASASSPLARTAGTVIFKGYLSAVNWTIYPLVLPLSVYLLRWVANSLWGTAGATSPIAVASLLPTVHARHCGRLRFLKLAVDGRICSVVAFLALATWLWDLSETAQLYCNYFAGQGKVLVLREPDWSMFFLRTAPGEPGFVAPGVNLIFVLAAYLNQLVLMFVGFFAVALILVHNCTYLKVIYRRSIATNQNPDDFIALDFNDAQYDRCFGLLSLNRAFNAQLYFLVVAGLLMLASRFANVSEAQREAFTAAGQYFRTFFDPAAAKLPVTSALNFVLVPDAGQIILIVSWALCFFIVCIPALLKFLPFFDQRIRHGGIARFLLEFLKPSHPQAIEPMPPAVIEELAWKFSRNSFWPTGDRRAHLLFYFALMVFFILLIPVKPESNNLLFFAAYVALLFGLSVFFTRFFFKTLAIGLSHFDERLVGSKNTAMPLLPDPVPASPPSAPQNATRSLLTLVFTDIIGSVKLKQTIGDVHGVRLIQAHHALVRELLKTFAEGREINTAGDSFFIVFVRPSEAVRFALSLQSRLRPISAKSPFPLQDRIGIHIGEVIIQASVGPKPTDFYGSQVDIASRVMSLASGDQILMTRSAFDNARQVLKGESIEGIGGISWVQHGVYQLKGVEEPLEICEVGELGAAALKPPGDGTKASRLKGSITDFLPRKTAPTRL